MHWFVLGSDPRDQRPALETETVPKRVCLLVWYSPQTPTALIVIPERSRQTPPRGLRLNGWTTGVISRPSTLADGTACRRCQEKAETRQVPCFCAVATQSQPFSLLEPRLLFRAWTSASRGQVAPPGDESPRAGAGRGGGPRGPAIQLQVALSAAQSSTGFGDSQTTSTLCFQSDHNATFVNLDYANLRGS